MERKMRGKKGFSLVELLIVIGIIAVLGGVMLTQFSGSTESALAASCFNNMRTLCNAVLADSSKQGDYPSAGPFRYMTTDGTQSRKWSQGWIGYLGDEDSCSEVSCYHPAGDEGLDQFSSITNGTIWHRMGGKVSAYVCPSHLKQSKRGNLPVPSWSYVMNSYFGWNVGLSVDFDAGRRSYGGMLEFMYTNKPEKRKRPPEKVLLFAEMPYADNGVQDSEWSTSADTTTDMILQYKAEGNEESQMNKAAEGAGEAIGFNHKSGNDYSAHIAFADGHCERLLLPRDCTEDDLVNLTTWLCTGQEYTFNGAEYEKASQ